MRELFHATYSPKRSTFGLNRHISTGIRENKRNITSVMDLGLHRPKRSEVPEPILI